jgi:ABC-2 type transport system ATP-binding protein
VVSGRHAASGDFGQIRRLMTDRPVQYVVVADDDRRLAASLIAEPSVVAVSLRREGGVDVSVCDFGAFAVRLPRVARQHGIRILELTPTDESLESVFAYLVDG